MSTPLVWRPDWADALPIRHFTQALEKASIRFCFAGGALRDSLMGNMPQDFDALAASNPEHTLQALLHAGFEAHISNVHYGTITAQMHDARFEINPLDAAALASALSFEIQAEHAVARYDLSINALFWIPEYALYNPFGGIEDIQAHRIRLMPQALATLDVQPLHILRFFRFHAVFGVGDPDSASLAACRKQAAHIERLPPAQKAKQMLALLASPSPSSTLSHMRDADIFLLAFGFEPSALACLAALEHIEQREGKPLNALERLAALALETGIPPMLMTDILSHHWQWEEGQSKAFHRLFSALIAFKGKSQDSLKALMADDPLLPALCLLHEAMDYLPPLTSSDSLLPGVSSSA